MVAAVAMGLRAFVLLLPGGAWQHPIDYDEGVYFAAASLMRQGLAPYRDFVFVHPPGWPSVIALTSAWLGVADGFVLSRWVAVGLGGLNVVLVSHLAGKWQGRLAAIVAGALYATYLEVVAVERGPFLEPMLNAACLVMVWCLDQAATAKGTRRWAALAGASGGLALSIKVWAGFWIVGAAWALWRFEPHRRTAAMVSFAVAGLVTMGVLVAPWAMLAPGAFVDEVIRFHLARPPDGIASIADRLEQIVARRHLAPPILAAMAVVALASRRIRLTPIAQGLVPAYVLTLVAFLASRAYWAQYNAHLIASEAVLAGVFAGWATSELAQRWPRLVPWALALALVAASVAVSLREIFVKVRRSPQLVDLTRELAVLPPEACVFAFEPAWTLGAGRVGQRAGDTHALVDTYAAMVGAATATGARFDRVNAAFDSPQSQREVRALLERCRFVVLGARGRIQLSKETQDWFTQTFEPASPRGATPDLWQQRRSLP